jgi:hypothetical protein
MDHNVFDFMEDLALPFAEFLQQCNITVEPVTGDGFLELPQEVFVNPQL